jgi:hypothetical protein
MRADRSSGSPATNLVVGESRRGPPAGALAQASDPDGSGPQGANHGWLAFFARQDVESKNPGWFTTRPQAIDKRPRQRPFLEGSPEAWPRGRYSPALAATARPRDAGGELALPLQEQKKSGGFRLRFSITGRVTPPQ